jgi:crotonobetainyl-CoA:carnitine CoA-transferase CaiB-like acyl-CoA transferase
MSKPLDGIRVLDLTRAAAGPFCSMILGDFGADVIKAEATPGGDLLRAFGPFHEGEGVYFLSLNRNKRSIALDFRSPSGLELLHSLAQRADVVLENFKPGVTEQMGLSYEQLRKVNPDVVYASITGFGSNGPYGRWPGVDQIAQGMSGFMSFTGTEESGPTRVGLAIGDLVAGMWEAIGILGAVLQRRATGAGQQVETSLLGGLIGLLSVQGQRYLSLGEVAPPAGNEHPVISPYGVFNAKDGPINLCVATQDMWASLCRILAVEELVDDPDFVDNSARHANRAALTDRLNRALARDTQAAWTTRLIEAGIPSGPIYDMAQVFADPHVQKAGFVQQVDHPTIGPLDLLANPARLGASSATIALPPPLLGQHSREVLAELGLSSREIESLIGDGTVTQSLTQSTFGGTDGN